MEKGCKTGTTNDVSTPMEDSFLTSFTNDSIPFLELTEDKTFPSMDGKTKKLTLPLSQIRKILNQAENERPPTPLVRRLRRQPASLAKPPEEPVVGDDDPHNGQD